MEKRDPSKFKTLDQFLDEIALEDDAPELTREWFEKAELRNGDVVIRPAKKD